MKRRTLIKKVGVAAGSLAVLPSWAHSWTVEKISSADGFLSRVSMARLASLVDTILPASKDGLGGLEVGVDQFLEKLFARCYEQEVQDHIKDQLQNLNVISNKIYQNEFENINQEQRLALFGALESSENAAEKDFFELIKSEAIRGFSTSRVVMTRYLRYRVVPGNYQGCVPVENNK